MKMGTKSLLFGIHNLVIHPLFVLVAFPKIHRRRPTLMETTAIILHDVGYWGKTGIDTPDGKKHPYKGAAIMAFLYGQKGRDLVLGHSKDTAEENSIPLSTLYQPDKYSWAIMPAWLHWILAKASGEWREFDERRSYGIGFNPWEFKKLAEEKFRQKTP